MYFSVEWLDYVDLNPLLVWLIRAQWSFQSYALLYFHPWFQVHSNIKLFTTNSVIYCTKVIIKYYDLCWNFKLYYKVHKIYYIRSDLNHCVSTQYNSHCHMCQLWDTIRPQSMMFNIYLNELQMYWNYALSQDLYCVVRDVLAFPIDVPRVYVQFFQFFPIFKIRTLPLKHIQNHYWYNNKMNINDSVSKPMPEQA